MFSQKSMFTRSTDSSAKTYAKAGVDPSYKYYNNITWSMWFALIPGTNRAIWSMYEDTSSANRSWDFSVQDDGTFRIIGSWDGADICLFKTVNPILDAGWHHVVVTFASSVFNVYVDNVLQSLTTVIGWGGSPTLTLNAANIALVIANRDPTSGPNVDTSPSGAFCNFSMWNKVLNSTEITSLFNGGHPGDLTQHSAYANLTNWYRMDQTDTLPTLTDSRAAGASATVSVTNGSETGYFTHSSSIPTAGADSDPGVSNVKVGVQYQFSGATETGTYDGSDRWSDPGVANVRSGTNYNANAVAKTGTLDLPATSNVKIGVEYDGDTKTGSYDGSDRWSDPGAGNVRQGTTYEANAVEQTGTWAGSGVAQGHGMSFPISIVCTRSQPGQYTNGVWVPNNTGPTTFTVNASVQPLGDRETQMLPEGDWNKEYIKIYADQMLLQDDDNAQTVADTVQYNGKTYKIIKSRDYTQQPVGLQHCRAVGAVIGTGGV